MGPIIAWAFLPFSSGDDRSSNPARGCGGNAVGPLGVDERSKSSSRSSGLTTLWTCELFPDLDGGACWLAAPSSVGLVEVRSGECGSRNGRGNPFS